MDRITVTVYGHEYTPNQEYEGVYKVADNGNWNQLVGNGQTPRFKTKKQFGQWIRRNLYPWGNLNN